MSEELVSIKLVPFQDDFAFLIEAGFVAAKQLDGVGATRIFCASQILNRFHASPQIGLGFIELNKMHIKQALKFFHNALELEPDNILARAFVGICYLLSKNKRKKGENIIKELLAKTKDETIINLCHVALEWSDKDLKKADKQNKLPELPEDS